MSCVILSETVRQWIGNDDVFARIKAIDGRVVRSKEGRTTQRFEINGEGFYAKLHEGIGWREIIKNCLQLKLPVVGASNEWQAINRLQQLGIPTLKAVAYGQRGVNPAAQQSFLITEELTGTLSLARMAESWPERPPSFALKHALIKAVASTASTMHGDGMNHRDLYICHFLVDISMGRPALTPDRVKLYLVDLHRAQMRAEVPQRWLVKDLASIYFSSLDVGITQRDVLRFLRYYFKQPLRDILKHRSELLKKTSARAVQLYRRDFRRDPVLPVKIA